jgi:hypothetical protein
MRLTTPRFLSCLVLCTPQAGRAPRAGGRAAPPPPPQYMLRKALASPRVGARITRVRFSTKSNYLSHFLSHLTLPPTYTHPLTHSLTHSLNPPTHPLTHSTPHPRQRLTRGPPVSRFWCSWLRPGCFRVAHRGVAPDWQIVYCFPPGQAAQRTLQAI